MIWQIDGVPLVLIEILDDALLTSPEINVVLNVSQMRSEAGTKVPCAKYEDFRIVDSGLRLRVDHICKRQEPCWGES